MLQNVQSFLGFLTQGQEISGVSNVGDRRRIWGKEGSMCTLKKSMCDCYQPVVSLCGKGPRIFLLLQMGHSLLVVLETAQVEVFDPGELRQVLDMINSAWVWSARRVTFTEEKGGPACARLYSQWCACNCHFRHCCCSVLACLGWLS